MNPTLKKLLGAIVAIKSIDKLKKESVPARPPRVRISSASLLLALLGACAYLMKSGRLTSLVAKARKISANRDDSIAGASHDGLARKGVSPLGSPTG